VTTIRKATKSSMWEFYYAQNTINGNLDSDLAHGSCHDLKPLTNPWWRVDLLDTYIVTSITITNRGDCCHTNINGAEILIGKSLQDNGIHNTLAGVITSIPAGRSLTLSWNKGIEGRYVAVVLPKTNTLVLCEVGVYGYLAPTGKNVALRGKATQLSLHGFGFAYNAIDRNRDNAMEHGSCTHTSGDLNPWWRLDLLNTYKVFSISNRKNLSYCSRLNGAEIRIGLFSVDNLSVCLCRCGVISSIPGGFSSTFQCNGMEGRHINVVIPGRSEHLTLCEVEGNILYVYEKSMFKFIDRQVFYFTL
uniref:Si:ch211-215k15.4 n=1 Tax=Oncorhynchus kisutch TaxID=8019 RepID=A0A8C7I667_ONCKI